MFPLPYHSVLALALFLLVVGGGVGAAVALDAVLFLGAGRDYTISHAMWLLGLSWRWLPWVWCAAGCAVTFGTAHHFWGLWWRG